MYAQHLEKTLQIEETQSKTETLQVAQTTTETVSRGHKKLMHTAVSHLLPWFVAYEFIELKYTQLNVKQANFTLTHRL